MRRLALALAAAQLSCVGYNQFCYEDVLEDAEDVVGHLGPGFELGDQKLRAGESPLGSVVADAIMAAFADRPPESRPDLAVVPAWHFQRSIGCDDQTVLQGGLLRYQLHSALRGAALVVVEVTGAELARLFEGGVSALPGLSVNFLHHSTGGAPESVVEADCQLPGARIKKLRVAGVDALADPARIWRVATADGMLSPETSAFPDLIGRQPVDRIEDERALVLAVERYLMTVSSAESPLAPPPAGRLVLAATCG